MATAVPTPGASYREAAAEAVWRTLRWHIGPQALDQPFGGRGVQAPVA